MKMEIRMPRLSSNMKTGVLTAWNKVPGDRVRRGETLFEVETDKVVSEVESMEDGILGEVYFHEGDTVAVDAVLAVIEGE